MIPECNNYSVIITKVLLSSIIQVFNDCDLTWRVEFQKLIKEDVDYELIL